MRLGFDAGDAQALARYERWRRFDSAVSAATFDGLNRLFASDATLLRSAREVGLGLVDRMPALKRFFVSEAAGLTRRAAATAQGRGRFSVAVAPRRVLSSSPRRRQHDDDASRRRRRRRARTHR